MNKKTYNKAMEALIPDEGMISRLIVKTNKKKRISFRYKPRITYLISSMLVLIVVMVWGISGLMNRSNRLLKDFVLTGGAPTSMRIGYESIGDLVSGLHLQTVNFVVVYADEIIEIDTYGRQHTEVIVLYQILGDTVHGKIKLNQYRFGGCIGETNPNFLRKGGIYVLPISVYDRGDLVDYFEVIGDMDVLFELDEQGLIRSHSMFEDFNRFDAKPINELIIEIINCASELNSTL